MSNKIERLNIGINKLKEKQYNLSLNNKKNAFNESLAYVSTFISVKDFKSFMEDMSGYFKTEFMTAYGSDFSSLMTYEKICELSNVELHKIKAYQNQFDNVDIELDPLTLEATTVPDHALYLNTEAEITKYLRGKFILDKMNEITAEGIDFNRNMLQRMFQDTFSYDWELNELIVNSK